MTWNWTSRLRRSEHQAITSLLDKTGTTEPRSAILARSHTLLAQFGQTEPPFPGEALGYMQGIVQVQEKDIPFDACLLPIAEGYRVELCKYHTRGRKRFSLAHEIAHTFLIEMNPALRLPKREIGIDTSSGRDLMEELCDLAAAELIWPMSIFRGDVWEEGLSLTSVIALSTRYNASLTSTARRMTETNLWKCYFIIWDSTQSQKNHSYSLSPRTIYRSASASPLYRHEVSVADWNSTVYEALHADQIVKGRDVMRLGGEPERYYVESMKLGKGGFGQVLSMIHLEPHAEYGARCLRTPSQFRFCF